MAYKSRLALLILLDSLIVSLAIFIAFWIVYPYSSTPYDYLIIGITADSLLIFHHIYAFLVNDFVICRRALGVSWMLHIILIGGSRFVWRVFRDRYISKNKGEKKRTLIVGAGDAGAMLARQLNTEANESELRPVAFVD